MTARRLSTLFAFSLLTMVTAASAQVIITLQNATAGFSQGGFPVTAAIDGDLVNGGWAHAGGNFDDAAVYETFQDASFPTYNFTMTMVFGDHLIGHLRVSTTTDDRSTFADGLQSGGAIAANWTVLTLSNLASQNGTTLTLQPDGSVLASNFASVDVFTFSANTSDTAITGFRLEVLTDPSLPFNGPGTQGANGNFVLTEFSVAAIPEPSTCALFGAGLLAVALVARRRR